MQLRTNKGPVLNQNDYLGIGDYLFAVSPTQPYSFCLVLTSDGDLQFFYGAPQNPQLGLGPTFRYSSVLQDWTHQVYLDPGFKAGQSGSYFAVMQSDGNFCVYRGTGPTDNQGFCWSTNTYGKSTPPYAAVLHTDGNVHVGGNYQSGGMTDLWKTNMLYPSQRVTTGDRLTSNQWLAVNDTLVAGQPTYGSGYPYMAWMRSADLVLACGTPPGMPLVLPPGSPGGSGTQPYWSATTNCPGSVYGRSLGGGMYAIMQDDGNFCLYNGTDPGHQGPVYWAISNQGKIVANYVAQLHADGTFTVGSQNTGSAPYWTSAQGTTLIIEIASGAGQTVTVNGGYEVVPYPLPMTVRVTYPSLVPVIGASVTLGQYASTEGMVTIYFAPDADLDYISTTVTTDNNGYASARMWGQSILGGPDQPGSVEMSINVAGFGGYPGAGNGSVQQYVWLKESS
jgi:hypothetical protein